MRSHAEWLALAGRSGLRTHDYREDDLEGISTSDVPAGTAFHAIVFDNQVFGAALPAADRARVIALAGLAEARLLAVDLIKCSEGDWWYIAASTLPDMRIGGEGHHDELTPALGGPST
jgi:hypothetical protein